MIIEQMSESYKYSRKLWSCSGKIALCALDNLDNQQNAFLEPTIAMTLLIYTEMIRIRKAILIVDDNDNAILKWKNKKEKLACKITSKKFVPSLERISGFDQMHNHSEGRSQAVEWQEI